jgi:transposase-like protein
MAQIRVGQVDIVETTKITIVCKLCGTDEVTKYGTKSGLQYYWCKKCKRKFAGNNALPGMRFPPREIASALNMFYEGLSLNGIRRHLDHDYNILPSDATVYEWMVRFTRQALEVPITSKARTGSIWAADETVLRVGGGRTKEGADNTIWFWDVLDEESRLLLASHMSRTRTIKDAEATFLEAQHLAITAPKFVVTDRLRSYIDGIERVFGAETVHIQSGGMSTETHNNLIERFHGTIKQRTKVMRGMHNLQTAELVMGGWGIHYNFFRPHKGLRGSTPGEVAQVGYPFKSWLDVVSHGYIATEKKVTVRLPT